MMKQTKKAFTLVELIIVITILAILATIGFMSYQSYTSDARNSKRTNDLASIESKFVVVVAKDPTKVLTSVDTGTINTGAMIAATFTAGSGTTLTYGSTYKAGLISYSTLGVDSASFSDPASTATGNYLLGVASTTTKGMLYQLAATLESNGDDAKQDLVRGFFATGGTDTAKGLIKAQAGTISASGIVNKDTAQYAY